MKRFPILVSALLLAVSCAEPAPPQPFTYAGPSVWTLDFSENNLFSLKFGTSVGGADSEIVGTYNRTGLGFTYLSIASFLDDELEQMYSVEAQGKTLILRLEQSTSEFVPMLSSPECPEASFVANYVALELGASADATDAAQAWFGTFSHNISDGTSQLATQYPLTTNTDLGEFDWAGLACAEGTGIVGTDRFFFSSVGDAIVHTDPANPATDTMLVTMPIDTLESAFDMDGNYAAIVLNKARDADTEYRTYGMDLKYTASGGGSATATGYSVTDIPSSVIGDATVTFAFTDYNLPSDGFMQGTVNIGSGTGKITCSTTMNLHGTSKKVLYCIGQSPDDNTKQFSMFAVSR